ncbi:hypothetical protein RB597_008390 [Gaeumannomyces tritici]
MDILLSLPIASYFLAPGVTSWSTSLNLLFFYMTWTTLVLSHSPLRIELVGTLAVRLGLYLAPALLSLAFDSLLPSLAGGVKVGGAASLPPRDPAVLARALGLAVANLALEAAAQAAVGLAHSALRPAAGPVFPTTSTLPLPWGIVKHVALLLAMRECLTYTIHRHILHSSSSSSSPSRRGSSGGGNNQLRRWHAGWGAHARSRARAAPYALLLAADHPASFLLHRFAPLYAPALLLRPHLLTFLLFAALVTAEETLAMSGYSVVPGIVMGGIARRTSAHFCGAGAGNYGAWGLLDWACGTSLGRDVVDDVKDEAEKHRVKERGESAANSGMSFIQQGIEGVRRSKRTRKTRTDAWSWLRRIW